MSERPYELVQTPEGTVARVRIRGSSVLSSPLLNRGTAFTPEERHALGLTGLLPSGVSTMEAQLRRTYAQFGRQADDLGKNVYLGNLRDRNEVLFYRLLTEHIEEMLPIVYTPTIGMAIERFSHEFRRPRGVYLSVDAIDDVEAAFRNYGMRADDVDLIVATDSEGILGIGDWGVGGIEIAIGKLAVYIGAAGIHPRRVIPVVLDMGTDNLALLNDQMYLGNRHARVRDQRYDDLVDAYVTTATKLFPDAMLHWEDFGVSNARRILNRYAEQVCTFNDDMQGTAAVVLAAAFAALRASGTRMRDQRVVIHGAGTAGIGIADMMCDVMVREGLSREEANRRFYALARHGLLVDDQGSLLRDFQVPYARPAGEVSRWSRSREGGGIGLADVVANAEPTMLIGTSTQPAAFTEQIVKQMASRVARPVIMPLSNPTSKAEALPEDLIRWTEGRALVATGSPFPPVSYNGRTYQIAQANNALIFPGLGLGVTVARARRISDPMLAAAADAVAELSDATTPGAALLPPVENLRTVSAAVGIAVATEAAKEGLARAEVGPQTRTRSDRLRTRSPSSASRRRREWNACVRASWVCASPGCGAGSAAGRGVRD
jgi:malate dehydrogenase (oxaloacetate-decarboxylating)